MPTLKPLGARVALRHIEGEETRGGIILPASSSGLTYWVCEVMHPGESKRVERGARVLIHPRPKQVTFREGEANVFIVDEEDLVAEFAPSAS